jgi:hypothetical protein
MIEEMFRTHIEASAVRATVVALLAFTVISCGGQPAKSPMPGGRAAEATSGQNVPPGPLALADACTLLTGDEVAAYVPQAKSSPATDSASGTKMCVWDPAHDTRPQLEVLIQPHDPALAAGGYETKRIAWQHEAKQHDGRFLEDLGDVGVVETANTSSGNQTKVMTYVGDTLIKVQLTGGSMEQARAAQDGLITLTRGILRRLK